ncbi:tRNA (guanosine(46)-N7)-methyltransferase TrmB [Proteocatella sphenisci]|uniref:tRNA (guanosine(46)-N7)-methyltransferase TrmB n=1 Tax=Proteocatella sphenisci TaxID=181070 RepID=UPI00048E3C10|nr:tRNA (guanosine(46)-N7)-methyltransferase TrmB [Proteocatella sphenisci]
MRYRKPKNYKDKIAECYGDVVIEAPENQKGFWKICFGNDNPIYIEIGMGKGNFLIEHALKNPHINYVGVEKIEPLLLGTSKKIQDLELENVKLIGANANFIEDYFEESEISRIYLNFSDPWPKKRNANRRLTHHNMLKRYQSILKEDSYIEFKTDNRSLFEFSVCEISMMGFLIEEINIDLHNQDMDHKDERLISTEYESKFVKMGRSIYRVKAKIDKYSNYNYNSGSE